MNKRLTLRDREAMAIELRSFLLERTEPTRLKCIEDPEAQPPEEVKGINAFEFFLNRYRPRFSKALEELAAYNAGWANMDILKSEQVPRSNHRVTRTAVSLFMSQHEDAGFLDQIYNEWVKAEDLQSFSAEENQRLKLFLYEIVYELMTEFVMEMHVKFS